MCYGYSIEITGQSLGVQTVANKARALGANRVSVCREHDKPRIDAGNRRSESAVEDALRRLGGTPAPAAPVSSSAPSDTPGQPLANDRQVSYIMSLIHQGAHTEGGFYAGPTTAAGVATMTRQEASTYITSLTGQY